jgi:eukaryotic-like serine/threonine-protein kinase
VHRDLKPANIKAPIDGAVKVLDFGLATVAQPAGVDASDPADSPTLAIGATQAGLILGTAAYMSPEQAAGRRVDRRSDIWSFGAVLWEMLTGKPLFSGETVSHTLADVLRAEIDFAKLPATTPTPVCELLKRCLDRDVRARLRDIGEARVAIQKWLANPVSLSEPMLQPGKGQYFAWIVAFTAVLVAAVLAVLHFRQAPPEQRPLTTFILPPEGASFNFSSYSRDIGLPALSPDGRRIVFTARSTDGSTLLWVRSLDQVKAQSLNGTLAARFPFWSPDSRFVGFFADDKLKRIDVSGGPPVTLADAPAGRGGSWSPNGTMLFSTGGVNPIMRIPANGGAATPATLRTKEDFGGHASPWFLPDGRHFLYAVQHRGGATIRVSSVDGLPGAGNTIAEASTNAVYADGYLLFARESTLMAQPFDEQRLVTTGEAVVLADPMISRVPGIGVAGAFSVSRTGLLSFVGGSTARGETLTWFNRSGKQLGTLGDPQTLFDLRFSPDRKSVAVSMGDPAGRNIDIWIYDVVRGRRSRLTLRGRAIGAVWSPDGNAVVYRYVEQVEDLYRKQINVAGPEELLYANPARKRPTSWSPDGKFILYFSNGDLWVLPVTPERPGAALKPFLFMQTPFNEMFAQFSPDGRWIVYGSDESQRSEIYVAPFPGPGVKRQISTEGGTRPLWRDDGKEIFYVAPDRRLMAAEVTVAGSALEVGEVRPLFGPVGIEQGYKYDVSADGQRFLVAVEPEQQSSTPVTLVQNWTALLRSERRPNSRSFESSPP